MVINCNGLTGKDHTSVFHGVVEQNSPDVIFACESKLDGSIHSESIFQDGYVFERRDRNANGGGVFIGICDSVDHQELRRDSCELLWQHLEFEKSGKPYVSSFNIITDVQVVQGMSDHDIVHFEINMSPKIQRKPPHRIYTYDMQNIPKIKGHIRSRTDHFLSSDPHTKSVDENWTFAKDTILYCKAKKTKLRDIWTKYTHQRNKVTNMMTSSYDNYMANIMGSSLEPGGNQKRFWSFIRSQRKEMSGTPALEAEGELYSTDHGKAQALNARFVSVFYLQTLPPYQTRVIPCSRTYVISTLVYKVSLSS